MGLSRQPPLSFLGSSYCSPRRRDNVRTTSYAHDASSSRGLTAPVPPLPTRNPFGWVSHLSPGPDGGPSLVGL